MSIIKIIQQYQRSKHYNITLMQKMLNKNENNIAHRHLLNELCTATGVTVI